MPRYVTVAEQKRWMRNEIAIDDDQWVEDALDAAEQWIDNECGRRFEVASGTPSARVFVPNGTPLLPIDDCVSVASITENGAALTAGAYQLEPLNGRGVSGEPVPFNTVRRLHDIDWFSDYGRATVSISADWGFVAIPALVRESCKIVAKDILGNRDVNFGVIAVTDSMAVSARMNPTVAKTIGQYGSPQGLTLVDLIGPA